MNNFINLIKNTRDIKANDAEETMYNITEDVIARSGSDVAIR